MISSEDNLSDTENNSVQHPTETETKNETTVNSTNGEKEVPQVDSEPKPQPSQSHWEKDQNVR
jgi:hypothetical protein